MVYTFYLFLLNNNIKLNIFFKYIEFSKDKKKEFIIVNNKGIIVSIGEIK